MSCWQGSAAEACLRLGLPPLVFLLSLSLRKFHCCLLAGIFISRGAWSTVPMKRTPRAVEDSVMRQLRFHRPGAAQ
eukprot:5160638-Pyramimonas_sp.AAC.1